MLKKVLRLQDVLEITGLSQSTIYRLMRLNKFPKSFNLTASNVGWDRWEIEKWLNEKIKESRRKESV